MRRTVDCLIALTACFGLAIPTIASASEPVTVENAVRAETDTLIRSQLEAGLAEFGAFTHARQPVAVDEQTVIRSNRDTLYSGLLLDLSAATTITLPDVGDRYMSLHVINQDHYMFVETEPGDYELTEQNVGSRYGVVVVRTFADPNDPDDIVAANAAQDQLSVTGGGSGPFEAPDWSQEDLQRARSAINELALLGFDPAYAFGTEEATRPIEHLVGAFAGWGGLPSSAAVYVVTEVAQNDGETPHAVTARDVPADAFWSVTVYNADGYLEPNSLGVNSYNNVTAEANPDGSYTIHFGACDDDRVNCIPISTDWNYTVRLYGPRQEVLDGSWTFPIPEPTE